MWRFCADSEAAAKGVVEVRYLWVATLITSLQLGHSPVILIWARVAERCWPHLGHANLMKAGFSGGGETRGSWR